MSLVLLAAWVGTFSPEPPVKPCADCAKPTIAAHAGNVRVLTPSDNTPPASGDVVLTSPVLGIVLHGRVEQGRVAVAWFDYDSRDSANGVIVLPAGTEPRFVEPAKPDVLAIQQALLHDE